jgi:hypothetical protein
MAHTPSSEAPSASKITPDFKVSNADLERFLGNCCDDTRRKIFGLIGLPKRKKRPWTEFWSAVGLATDQPEDLWEELSLGSKGTNVLWDATRVAGEAGLAASTVNGYCHKSRFPDGFPKPLIDAGPKTRLWLPLEVRAYNQPSIYGVRAAMIRRNKKPSSTSTKGAAIPYTGTMQPLPAPTPNAG